MELRQYDEVPYDQCHRLWSVYESAFDDLRTRAVQRHVMYREEFETVLDDKRVVKLVVVAGAEERIAGIATVTNDLSSMPLISPEYFAERWPDLYEDQRIWYVGFLAVAVEFQGSGASSQLMGGIYGNALRGGVIAVDICGWNESKVRLPVALLRLARTFSPTTALTRLDSQTYWAYEFPPAVSA